MTLYCKFLCETVEMKYQYGFGNTFASEALPGALPQGQNNPQQCPYGLVTEQLSGTAFTAPRHSNRKTWLYRGRPSVTRLVNMRLTEKTELEGWKGIDFEVEPNQLRWNPLELPSKDANINFVQGVQIIAKSGDPLMKSGLAIYVYAANTSMDDSCFNNCDGDLLIVPQLGRMTVRTELGILEVEPNEICVVQRGMLFSIDLPQHTVIRGYILEIYANHFELPELGPIGANGLASPQDFAHPVAWYDENFAQPIKYRIWTKYGERIYFDDSKYSPFDVVAFRGNYLPFKYDLRKFMCVNSVTYDHPDPSIYTVLTCPSNQPGTSIADFVVFPPRWIVMEHTFRPPWFHRNTMSEFMGMIWGEYDAKQAGESGFVPGGASLHGCMSAHGPDDATFQKASEESLSPQFYDKGLAFMFETSYILKVSGSSRSKPQLQKHYSDCWSTIECKFEAATMPSDEGHNILVWRQNNSSTIDDTHEN